MLTRPSQPIIGRIIFHDDFRGHARFKQGEQVKLHGADANGAVRAGLDISESRTTLRWQLYAVKGDDGVSPHKLFCRGTWTMRGGILEKPFDPNHSMIEMDDVYLIMTKIKDKSIIQQELSERCEVLGLPFRQRLPEDSEAHICGLALRLYDPESNRVVFETGYSNKIRDTIVYGPPKLCEVIQPVYGEPEGGVMRMTVTSGGSHTMSPEGKLYACFFDGDKQIAREKVFEKHGPKGGTIRVRYPSITLLPGETTKSFKLRLETEYGAVSDAIQFTYRAPPSTSAADDVNHVDHTTFDEIRKGDKLATSSIHRLVAQLGIPTEDHDETIQPYNSTIQAESVEEDDDHVEDVTAEIPNQVLQEFDVNSPQYTEELRKLRDFHRAKKEETGEEMEKIKKQLEDLQQHMLNHDRWEQYYNQRIEMKAASAAIDEILAQCAGLNERAEKVVVNGIEKEELGLIDAEEEHMDVDENHAIEEEGLDGQSQAEGDRMSTDTSVAKAQESVEASEVDISHATTSPTFYTALAQPEQTPASLCTSLTSAQSISPATSATSDPALFNDVNGSALVGTSTSSGRPTALFPVSVVQQPSFGGTTVLPFEISSIPSQMPDEQRREEPFAQRENFLDHTGQLSSHDNGGGLGSRRMCKMVVAPNPASKQPQRTFDGNKVYNLLSNEKVDSFFNMKQPGSVKAGDSARTADPPLAFTYNHSPDIDDCEFLIDEKTMECVESELTPEDIDAASSFFDGMRAQCAGLNEFIDEMQRATSGKVEMKVARATKSASQPKPWGIVSTPVVDPSQTLIGGMEVDRGQAIKREDRGYRNPTTEIAKRLPYQISTRGKGGQISWMSPRNGGMIAAPNLTNKPPQRSFGSGRVYHRPPMNTGEDSSLINSRPPESVQAGESALTADPVLPPTSDQLITDMARKRKNFDSGRGLDQHPPKDVPLEKSCKRRKQLLTLEMGQDQPPSSSE